MLGLGSGVPFRLAIGRPSLSELRALLADLFGDGTTGLAFFPQPLLEGEQTMYQLEDGTTLTDANGDPVGLGLEWSQGLLGPELVTNGTFDTDLSGWTQPNGTYQWESGGVVGRSSTGTQAPFYQTVSTTPGKIYKVTIDVLNFTNNPVYYFNGGFDPSWSLVEGVNTRHFEATGTSSDFGLYTVAADITFTSISVKEIPGNHLTQPISADRPLYQTDGTLHWLAFDGAGDSLGVSFPTAISQPFTKITVANVKNDEGRISGSGVNTYGQCWRDSPTSVNMFAGTPLSLGGVDMTQTNVFVEIYDGANSKLRAVTGSSDKSVTGDAGTNSLGGFYWAERFNDLYGQVDAYGGIVVSGIPSDADIDKAVSYLASRAGITL